MQAVRRYINLRKASVSSEIISNKVPQRMKIKKDPVKYTPRTAYISGENYIWKWTSAEVKNSDNDCPFVVIMLNQTKKNQN